MKKSTTCLGCDGRTSVVPFSFICFHFNHTAACIFTVSPCVSLTTVRNIGLFYKPVQAIQKGPDDANLPAGILHVTAAYNLILLSVRPLLESPG